VQRISWDDALGRIAKLMKERPGRELRRNDGRRQQGQPLADDGHAGRVGEQQRIRGI